MGRSGGAQSLQQGQPARRAVSHRPSVPARGARAGAAGDERTCCDTGCCAAVKSPPVLGAVQAGQMARNVAKPIPARSRGSGGMQFVDGGTTIVLGATKYFSKRSESVRMTMTSRHICRSFPITVPAPAALIPPLLLEENADRAKRWFAWQTLASSRACSKKWASSPRSRPSVPLGPRAPAPRGRVPRDLPASQPFGASVSKKRNASLGTKGVTWRKRAGLSFWTRACR